MEEVTPPYIDHQNRFRTQSLFYEKFDKKLYAEGFRPLWTLKDWDYTITLPDGEEVTLPSFKRLYLEAQDPEEYGFVQETLGYWRHWEKLCSLAWFRAHIDEWRSELEIKLRGKAVKAMIKTALTEGSKGTTAAKFIAQKGWEEKRGRPSKEKIQKEARIQQGIQEDLEEDVIRMQEFLDKRKH